MAKAKKKAKSKSKVKRKKLVARRKPVRKVLKKVVKAAKKVLRKPRPKAATPPAPPPPPPGDRIGTVTHYYAHVSVAVVKLDPGVTLRVGDNIHVKGHTSDFGQRVESLQIGHAQVDEVSASDDFGLKVSDHAREHDVVYRVKPS